MAKTSSCRGASQVFSSPARPCFHISPPLFQVSNHSRREYDRMTSPPSVMVRLQAPLLLGAVVCIIMAQDLSTINNLPECGVRNNFQSLLLLTETQKVCINNMLGLAPSLGCANNNITCLCSDANFGYGVQNCSTESCPQGTDTDAIVSAGVSFCSSQSNQTVIAAHIIDITNLRQTSIKSARLPVAPQAHPPLQAPQIR